MIDMNLQVRTTSRDDDNACLHITTNLLDQLSALPPPCDVPTPH